MISAGCLSASTGLPGIIVAGLSVTDGCIGVSGCVCVAFSVPWGAGVAAGSALVGGDAPGAFFFSLSEPPNNHQPAIATIKTIPATAIQIPDEDFLADGGL